MAEQESRKYLPAGIIEQIAGIPKALVPATVRALDRLIGAMVDIPIALLNQTKAKIDVQTEAYKAIEAAIANAAASKAGSDPELVQRAIDVLVRKAYRKQANREAVSAAMLLELDAPTSGQAQMERPHVESPEEEWLDVFERYAEDASTERMQKLWGRVIAGEIRKSGSFSMRTLRFLSEFSRDDALYFATFSDKAFGDSAPAALVRGCLENRI